jgi:hypothetical protein
MAQEMTLLRKKEGKPSTSKSKAIPPRGRGGP